MVELGNNNDDDDDDDIIYCATGVHELETRLTYSGGSPFTIIYNKRRLTMAELGGSDFTSSRSCCLEKSEVVVGKMQHTTYWLGW